jgi:ferredoxin-like protein FixX
MRNPLRVATQTIFVMLLAASPGASAFKDYQVMAFFENAPLGADMAALMAAQSLFDSVVQWLMTCDILGPGQVPTNRNRELAAEMERVVERASNSSLRGGREVQLQRREKTMMKNCPNSCTKSGSTKCQSLGCAFCGTCRRELTSSGSGDFTLSTSNALNIEKTFNAVLRHFCRFRSRCRIYVKVFLIQEDGTPIPLTGS